MGRTVPPPVGYKMDQRNKCCGRACLGLVIHITIRDPIGAGLARSSGAGLGQLPFRPEAAIRIPSLARQTRVRCRGRFDRAGHGRAHATRLPRSRTGGGSCSRSRVRRFVDDACAVAHAPRAAGTAAPAVLQGRECVRGRPPRTGNLEQGRADSIARVAVREAYHRRIPPALVLGVMLTENDQFKRNARSKVGAMGLMQIMPRIWMPNLGPILGRNLKDDETNLRYGVYILKHFAKRTADTLDAANVTKVALLSYNGCVRGTNTRGLPRVSREGASARERERADDLLRSRLPRMRRASAVGGTPRHDAPARARAVPRAEQAVVATESARSSSGRSASC